MTERVPTNVAGHGALELKCAAVEWRCAGCDSRIRGLEPGLPAFCPFCRAWAEWRLRDDELWAKAISGWQDDGGGERLASHTEHAVAHL